MRNRTAAVILAAAALVGTSTAIAGAATPLANRAHYTGPFATQAACTTAQVARNNPPDIVTTDCFYFTVSPGLGAGPGPGWFYRYTYLIS